MLHLDCPVPFIVSIGIYFCAGRLAAGGMHMGNSGGIAGESITAGGRFITAKQVTCHLLRYAALDVIITRSIELRRTARHRDNASSPVTLAVTRSVIREIAVIARGRTE